MNKKKCGIKRFYAVFLAMLLVLQSVTILAAETDESWTVTKVGDFTKTAAAEKSETHKYDGSKAMEVTNKETKLVEGRYVEIKNTLSSSAAAGEYALKFYILPGISQPFDVVIGDLVISSTDIDASNAATVPSGDTATWKEYTKNITLDKAADSLSFRIYYKTKDFYIDNVSLIKKDTTENLVSDFGFENEKQTVDPDPTPGPGTDPDPTPGPGTDPDPTPTPTPGETVVTKNYQPTKVILSAGSDFINLSWYNPQKTDLRAVSLYDITGEETKLLSDQISATPSARVDYKITGLTSKSYHQYKIVFDYNDETSYAHYIGGQVASQTLNLGTNWRAQFINYGTAGHVPVEVCLDTTDAAEGNASLKIVSNIDRTQEQYKGNIYIRLDQTLPLDLTKKYAISFRIKGKNVGSLAMHMNWSWFDGKDSNISEAAGTYEWKKVDLVYSAVEKADPKNMLVCLLENSADAIWLDDFRCYLLDESGNKTGENLFKDGGFENLLTAAKAELSDFNVKATTGGALLSWTNPSANYVGSNIYVTKNGEKICLGKLSPNVNSLNFEGLEEETQYTFAVVPINSDYQEGTESAQTITTLINDYEVSQPFISKNKTNVNAFDGAGNYSVSVTAKNNKVSAGIGVHVIAALYKDNALVKIYSAEETLLVEKNVEKSVTIPSFEVAEGEADSMVIYVVDSRTNFEMYYSPVIMKK